VNRENKELFKMGKEARTECKDEMGDREVVPDVGRV